MISVVTNSQKSLAKPHDKIITSDFSVLLFKIITSENHKVKILTSSLLVCTST